MVSGRRVLTGLVVGANACGDDDAPWEAGVVQVNFEDERGDLTGTIESCESQDDASIALPGARAGAGSAARFARTETSVVVVNKA
jgi:hypothetical protein